MQLNKYVTINDAINKWDIAKKQFVTYYMFMHEDKNYLHFKHKLTREYIKIRKEVI